MRKNKYFIGIVVVIVVAIAGILLWLNFKQPTSFLSEAAMVEEMNSYTSSLNVKEIQDVLQLDEHHYFVPFVNYDGTKAMSFWKWDKAKWKLVNLTTHQKMRWQLDEKDLSSSFIVWNRSSAEDATMKLLFYRERNFLSSRDNHFFTPQVLLTEEITLSEYGITKVPEQWSKLMAELDKSAGVTNNSMFSFFNYNPNYLIAAEYNFEDFETNGTESYWTGKAETTLEFIMYYDLDRIQ
ncbi:hypothetical protein [Solibacillus sp. FSL K6-4121]|uniref:hypothetical protein n=1 Tax=Solibacillus sp. FSL K6-4121 TaxID=2921505 RepID=UPI0030F895F8